MVLSDDEIFGTRLIQRASKVGVSGFTAHERAKLIANAFFADRPSSERYAIELQFDELVHHIAELITEQDPDRARTAIRTILSELVFLRDGFGPGKRPRRNRPIGPDTLAVLVGRLPPALAPPRIAGLNFGDFGKVAFVAMPVGGECAAFWLTSANSLLFPAFTFLFDANGQSASIGRLLRDPEPKCLNVLDVSRCADSGEPITAGAIRNLTGDDLNELRLLAENSIDWLRAIFSIRSDNDPLNFSVWQFLTPNATGRILSVACEHFAQGLDDGDAARLDSQLSMGAVRDDDCGVHEHALQPIYWHVFSAIRHVAMRQGLDGETFAQRAHAIGLLKPDSDPLDRYMVHFVRLFRQVQALYRARTHLIGRLSPNGQPLEFGSKAALSDDGLIVSYDDYHKLGRWSDYLKALLQFGLVERSRDAGVRLRLPKEAVWEFPSVPLETPIDVLTRLVIAAARKPPGAEAS